MGQPSRNAQPSPSYWADAKPPRAWAATQVRFGYIGMVFDELRGVEHLCILAALPGHSAAAGKYRLAQPVILPDGTEYTLYAEFTIE